MKNADKPIVPIINSFGNFSYESAINGNGQLLTGLTKREHFTY